MPEQRSVPAPSNDACDLSECFATFTSSERLRVADGDGYLCEHCGGAKINAYGSMQDLSILSMSQKGNIKGLARDMMATTNGTLTSHNSNYISVDIDRPQSAYQVQKAALVAVQQ